jgi:hypothetical protein
MTFAAWLLQQHQVAWGEGEHVQGGECVPMPGPFSHAAGRQGCVLDPVLLGPQLTSSQPCCSSGGRGCLILCFWDYR